MPPKKSQREAAARARANRHPTRPVTPEPLELAPDIPDVPLALLPVLDEEIPELYILDSDSDCEYEGGVNVELSDDDYDPELEHDSDFTDSDLSEFDEEIIEALKKEFEVLLKPTPFEELNHAKSKKDWSKAEASRSLGYNGLSERTHYRHNAEARTRELKRTEAKASTDPQIVMMRNMFAPKPPPPVQQPPPPPQQELSAPPASLSPAELVDYPSDHSESDEDSGSDADDEGGNIASASGTSRRLPAVPPRKRRKLDVPAREMRKRKQAAHQLEFEKALADIQKQIKSKKTKFDAGHNSLQEYRVRAIQSYLIMVVKHGRLTVEASERAAEAQGFAAKWGGRSVREWTRVWIKTRKLPTSRKGRHAKVYSFTAFQGDLC
ncbi:hypothetical protein B0H16DRAFT_1749993 [Mycena metata]|uniref:Uncharacterized protein n=1 Tax=Mycena metata TaxID=1033252 RepID=A0AAD7DQR3_9AGAR|nr:hypothetical protein B0H16DRAFT_1749993 [Mycena metata]